MCLSTGSPSPRRTHHTSRSSKHSASHQQHSASHQQHEQVREETSRERKSATRSGCQYSSKRTGKLTRQRSVESWAAEDEHDARREMKRREYAGLSTGYKESSYNHSDNNSRHRISLYGTYCTRVRGVNRECRRSLLYIYRLQCSKSSRLSHQSVNIVHDVPLNRPRAQVWTTATTATAT